jgi:hypothetical protein
MWINSWYVRIGHPKRQLVFFGRTGQSTFSTRIARNEHRRFSVNRAEVIRPADRKTEFIASLKDFRWALGAGDHIQISVAPDYSPIFTRNIGTQEVYSLRKWP